MLSSKLPKSAIAMTSAIPVCSKPVSHVLLVPDIKSFLREVIESELLKEIPDGIRSNFVMTLIADEPLPPYFLTNSPL